MVLSRVVSMRGMHSAILFHQSRTSVCLSVCLSAFVSDTLWYYALRYVWHTPWFFNRLRRYISFVLTFLRCGIISKRTHISSNCSSILWRYQPCCWTTTPLQSSKEVLNARVGLFAILDRNRRLSHKQYETGPWSLIGSHGQLIHPSRFQWPRVTLKGRTTGVHFF